MAKDAYQIGYRKPPKATQFKPGQSGNPKGRPSGTRNLKTDLEDELGETITVTEAGKLKRLSKQRALLKSLVAKALKGDTKAIAIVLGMVDRHLKDSAEDSSDVDDAADAAIVEAFREKVLKEAANGNRE